MKEREKNKGKESSMFEDANYCSKCNTNTNTHNNIIFHTVSC